MFRRSSATTKSTTTHVACAAQRMGQAGQAAACGHHSAATGSWVRLAHAGLTRLLPLGAEAAP